MVVAGDGQPEPHAIALSGNPPAGARRSGLGRAGLFAFVALGIVSLRW